MSSLNSNLDYNLIKTKVTTMLQCVVVIQLNNRKIKNANL